MPANHNRFLPAGHQSGDITDNNGLPEDSATQDIPDGAIGRLPHLLEFELLNSSLIRRDGRALDADLALPDGLGSLDGDLVVGLVAVLDAQVEVLNVEIEERQDELVLDVLPDDSGHLVAVKLGHGVAHFDLSTFHIFPMIFYIASPFL